MVGSERRSPSIRPRPPSPGESASRTDASNGSVTFTSDEAGKAYYIVGGEKPTQDALLASANEGHRLRRKRRSISGLGTEATNVYLMVVDAAGNKSDIKTVKVPVYLAKPTTLTWVNGTSTAMWSEVPGAASYCVQLYKDGAEVAPAVTADTTSYTFTLEESAPTPSRCRPSTAIF